jgi:hypothetical protein
MKPRETRLGFLLPFGLLPLLALIFVACNSTPVPDSGGAHSAVAQDETRQIAKDAYVYGFPLVANYQTMYKQAIDTKDMDYRAPFNQLARSKGVATPDDKFVVTPNSDTPYSFLWLDLRAEPVVVTMPKIEKGRYYTAQLIDLYTFDFAYLGSRTHGNDGGQYLIAGPGWTGETPNGISEVIHCETQFAYVLFRTQLFSPADLLKVKAIQDSYNAEPLSKFLGQPAPAAASAVTWIAPEADMTTSPEIFKYVDFLLQFCPANPVEKQVLDRFAKINVGAGDVFDIAKFPTDDQKAILGGIADGQKDMEGLMQKINAEQVSSGQMFGTREAMKGNYLYRYAGAKLGLYGNSGAEAIYLAYFVDASGKPLDASVNNYTLHFDKGNLPDAKAFWSLTMYDGKSQLLVANPLHRYLLNSTMLKALKYDKDGGLTLYVQKNSPGAALQANWLPAPDGPFYGILRVYMPGEAVQNATWKKPLMQPVSAT